MAEILTLDDRCIFTARTFIVIFTDIWPAIYGRLNEYCFTIPESSLEVERNSTLEWYFCQAVQYNYEKALQAVLTNVENPSAFVNKDYTIEVGTPQNIYSCTIPPYSL